MIRASNHCYYGVGASMTHKFYVNSSKRLEINSTNTLIYGGLQVNLGVSDILEVVGTAGLNMTINRSGTSFANYGTGTYYKLNNKNYGALLMGIESSNYGYFCLDPLNNNVLPGTSGLYTQGLMWGDWTNGVQVNSTFTAPNFIASPTIFSTMTNTLRLNGGVPGSQWGQIHMNNGAYNFIMRQDGNDLYFLIGSNPDGQWNSLRPLYIQLASGLLVSENGQNFTGGTTINTTCLLSSGVPLRLATGNGGDTGIAMELASGTTPIMNLQSNFRGTTNTAHLGACFRIDTRNSPLYQWFYRPAGSGTENIIMNLNSSGNLGCSTLTLSNTSQQTSAPRQVLIGSNNTVSEWGQLMSYSFRCGGGGFGWGTNCWMDVVGGQYNSGPGALPASSYMVKSTSGSRISFSGTWSAYLGANLMGMNVYFYNVSNGQYYFGGTFYQYQNISGNHACGGAHGFVEGIPAGNYLMVIQASGVISTDTNDHCSFSVIIHP